jgi:hypothetical protein
MRAGRAVVSAAAGTLMAAGVAIDPAFAAAAHPISPPCGGGTLAVTSAVLLGGATSTSPSASPSSSGTSSSSSSPSPSKTSTTAPTTSASSSQSPSPSASNSPSPSKSPSPSPSHSRTRSPSPSPSPTRSHRPGILCVTAQILRHESDTSPGGAIKVSIWVWSTTRARHVRATVTSSAHAILTPRFTLCPVNHGTTCSIGALRANQAFELMVTDKVKPTARIGRPIALAVTVSARDESPAQAAVAAVVGQGIKPPSTPPPLPPGTLLPIPGATISPAGLSGLFPTVTPQPSTSSSPSAHGRQATRATETSSALPLDSRLIGPQLAGLAVLAAAITMVVARLSLRTAQAPAGSGTGGSGTGGADTGESGTGGSGTDESEAGESVSVGEASDDKSAS